MVCEDIFRFTKSRRNPSGADGISREVITGYISPMKNSVDVEIVFIVGERESKDPAV